MKVMLRKNVKNWFGGADGYYTLDLDLINKAITEYYLPYMSPSPLKTFLSKKLEVPQQMCLYLSVHCEENSIVVKSISLRCGLLNDAGRKGESDKIDWDKVEECITENFQSIGYPGIQCTDDEAIASFLKRLEQDVPLAKEYFKVLYKYNEDIARVGYFGEHDEYEVYVKTDDEEKTPHFHIRDAETQGGRFETCVCLETNRYCLHGEYKNVLAPEQQALLKAYMESFSPCKPYMLVSNYERAAELWNINNEATQVALRYNSEGEVIIPDYSKII